MSLDSNDNDKNSNSFASENNLHHPNKINLSKSIISATPHLNETTNTTNLQPSRSTFKSSLKNVSMMGMKKRPNIIFCGEKSDNDLDFADPNSYARPNTNTDNHSLTYRHTITNTNNKHVSRPSIKLTLGQRLSRMTFNFKGSNKYLEGKRKFVMTGPPPLNYLEADNHSDILNTANSVLNSPRSGLIRNTTKSPSSDHGIGTSCSDEHDNLTLNHEDTSQIGLNLRNKSKEHDLQSFDADHFVKEVSNKLNKELAERRNSIKRLSKNVESTYGRLNDSASSCPAKNFDETTLKTINTQKSSNFMSRSSKKSRSKSPQRLSLKQKLSLKKSADKGLLGQECGIGPDDADAFSQVESIFYSEDSLSLDHTLSGPNEVSGQKQDKQKKSKNSETKENADKKDKKSKNILSLSKSVNNAENTNTKTHHRVTKTQSMKPPIHNLGKPPMPKPAKKSLSVMTNKPPLLKKSSTFSDNHSVCSFESESSYTQCSEKDNYTIKQSLESLHSIQDANKKLIHHDSGSHHKLHKQHSNPKNKLHKQKSNGSYKTYQEDDEGHSDMSEMLDQSIVSCDDDFIKKDKSRALEIYMKREESRRENGFKGDLILGIRLITPSPIDRKNKSDKT